MSKAASALRKVRPPAHRRAASFACLFASGGKEMSAIVSRRTGWFAFPLVAALGFGGAAWIALTIIVIRGGMFP